MPWFAPLIYIGGAAVGVGGYVLGRRSQAKRRALWREVAHELGGEFLEPTGLLRLKPAAIDVELGTARVRMDITSSGDVSYTRVRASFPLGAGPRFSVYKDGFVGALGNTLFGKEDVVLGGHEKFDDYFVVRCKGDPDVVRSMWTHDAKELALAHFKKANIQCDGRTLTLLEPKIYKEGDVVIAALRLIGLLASVDIYGRAILSDVEGGDYRETDGPWDSRTRPGVFLEVPSRVLIGPEKAEGGVVTVARLQTDVALPDLEVAVDPQSTTGDTSTLPSATKPYFKRVGSGRLVVAGGRASFSWKNVVDDPALIRESAEMLCTLAAGEEGVYR